MLLENGLPQLLSDTSITALVVFVMYRIIIKLVDRIPVVQA